MKEEDIIIISDDNDSCLRISIKTSFLKENVLNQTLLEINTVANLDRITTNETLTNIVFMPKNLINGISLQQIAILFKEKLIENQVRAECIAQFSEIRDRIFHAAFQPLETGKH